MAENIRFEEFQEVAEQLKEYIEKEFSKEEYDKMIEVASMSKKQEKAIEYLAEHYYDSLYPDNYDGEKLDSRFAYYDIIETCLKHLKDTDKTFNYLISDCIISNKGDDINENERRNRK